MTRQTKKRRARLVDPLASVSGVKGVLSALRQRCPELIPKNDKQLASLLNAARHAESYAGTATKRGRPSPWTGEMLLTVARELKAILARETQGRISLSSFVGVYLRILHFPADVTLALEKDQINLQEAILLARLTPKRLGMEKLPAKQLRQEILDTHLQAKGSQNSLRLRVHDLLRIETGVVSSATMLEAVQKVDELLEVDPDDLRHLFFEQIRNLFYALKEIEPEEVTETDLVRFSEAIDKVFNVIQSIRQRRKRQALPRPFSL